MKDQLSALIDGEFDIEHAEHLVTSVKSGGELKTCWAHYHLIGDAMRGGMQMSQDFSIRVMNALESEPTVLAPNSQVVTQILTKKSIYKTAKLWSVAASAAAVMFVSVMVSQFNQAEELTPVAIAQSLPTEYLQAHQAAAPNGVVYYIQTADVTEPRQ